MNMEHTHRVSTDEIIAMYNNGMSQSDIARATGMSQATVGYRMRRAGFMVGKGRHNPFKGGAVADTIPTHEYKVSEDEVKAREKQEIAEKNAANACLMVEDRCYSLRGKVGTYEVSIKSGFVSMKIGETMIELEKDTLAALVDELKALARNMACMDVGCEMW
jgi:hypothetical protein